MPRYKNPQYQKMYDAMLALAEDKASEMYHEGEPRRGAGHRAAFWDGYSGKFDFTGPKRSAHVIPGTPSAVCFKLRPADRLAGEGQAADAGHREPIPGKGMKGP